MSFLVADTRLYKRHCPSVQPSVGPSVEVIESKRGKTSVFEAFCICVCVGRGVVCRMTFSPCPPLFYSFSFCAADSIFCLSIYITLFLTTFSCRSCCQDDNPDNVNLSKRTTATTTTPTTGGSGWAIGIGVVIVIVVVLFVLRRRHLQRKQQESDRTNLILSNQSQEYTMWYFDIVIITS